MNVLPPSNLGPLSQPWGDEITRQTLANERAIQRLGGDFSVDGSLNNSTLDSITNQIRELQQRQFGIVTAPDFTTASFTNPNSVTNSVTLQIPRPDVPRIGWVSVRFTATNSNALQTEVYGSFSIDGTVFHRDSRTVPSEALEPASWQGQKALTGYTGFTATPSSGGTITLTLQAEAALSSGARIVTYSGIQASYQYGQRV